MLIAISPAKTLDFETPLDSKRVDPTKLTTPDFLARSAALVACLRERPARELARMMSISPKLAELNMDRYRTWEPPFTVDNARPAAFAFRGDVYFGLDIDTFSKRDLQRAQKTLRILSGLYGVLRPLDLIQPYRLEMGTRLATDAGKDLYCFWGDAITEALNAELRARKTRTLVNLASNEYFKSVRPELLDADIVTPVFRDLSKGRHRVISFYAKKARGLMARWIIRNRIDKVEDIKQFDVAGYYFSADHSRGRQWAFLRDSQP